jgi:hypothetical protein
MITASQGVPSMANGQTTTGVAANGQTGSGGAAKGLKKIGGLLAVWAGLGVLLLIAIAAMIIARGGASNVAAIATSAFGVIGTVIGAYFGVKVGTDGTQAAIQGLQDQATKTASFAAHVDPKEAAGVTATYSALSTKQAAPASGLPVVTGIVSNSGPAAGGETVTITGNSFTDATTVRFGSNDAQQAEVRADTLITAMVPAGTAGGTVDVIVTTPAGTSGVSSADRYTYV